MRNKTLSRFLVAIFLLPIASPVLGWRDSAANLAGVWGSERIFGPEVRGELTIVEKGAVWHAYISGFEATVHFDNGALTFALAGDRGEFRGRLTKDATRIIGHWIQPRNTVQGARYATPVELKTDQNKVWRGQVVPLDDRLSLYLVIRPRSDGSLGAFLRNPERNVGRGFRFGQVLLKGDVIRFTGLREGEDILLGKYDKQRDRLSIPIQYYGVTFEFTRRGRDEAPGFYPRTPTTTRYAYRQPLAEDDGWATASLNDVDLDPKPISALIQQILLTETEDVRTPYIQGLLIARNGKLVLEEYFYGFHKDRPHDTRSAGKSLTSALIGIAIDRGTKFDVSTSAYSLFPKYTKFAREDPRKKKITVEHLLMMASGYDCDDNDDSSLGNEDRMQNQTDQSDWYKYALDLPMVRNPGEQAVYCTAGINLLGGIISNATGAWQPDFLYEHFARPLDIHRYHINLMPLGNAYMGGGIYMRPRNFIKLGQLFLSGGRWNGRQVVSKQWVDRATRPHSSINSENDYGYALWINEYRVGEKKYRAFHAGGNGGQFVIVIPDLDLVVMFAGGNYGDFRTWSKFRDDLVPRFIIPSAVRQ